MAEQLPKLPLTAIDEEDLPTPMEQEEEALMEVETGLLLADGSLEEMERGKPQNLYQ
jgi:hypothetical protein